MNTTKQPLRLTRAAVIYVAICTLVVTVELIDELVDLVF